MPTSNRPFPRNMRWQRCTKCPGSTREAVGCIFAEASMEMPDREYLAGIRSSLICELRGEPLKILLRVGGSILALLDLTAVGVTHLRFRTGGLFAVQSILVLQAAGTLAQRESGHHSSHRLVLHGQDSTDQDSDPDPVSAAALRRRCGVYNGNLYISSNPGNPWNDDILRDPHVRIKSATSCLIAPCRLSPIQLKKRRSRRKKKYSPWKAPPVSKATVCRVLPV